MSELHQHLITLGLQAAADRGFALAGGYAVQAYHVVERLSDVKPAPSYAATTCCSDRADAPARRPR
jgi:hypothetical protein